MTALNKIRAAGFELTLIDSEHIEIKPFLQLTPQQCEFIKQHKAELITDLREEKAVNDVYHLVVTCYTPLGNPINVLATTPECAELLQKRNPKP